MPQAPIAHWGKIEWFHQTIHIPPTAPAIFVEAVAMTFRSTLRNTGGGDDGGVLPCRENAAPAEKAVEVRVTHTSTRL